MQLRASSRFLVLQEINHEISSLQQSLVQLQAGHVDQRPRSNGRGFIPVPAPVSVSRQSSISPYGQMTAPTTYQASFPSSPGMYDKMV